MTRRAACLAFLRGLEGHAVARLRGGELTEHARSCVTCADHLKATARQIRLLSGLQPPIPEAVASPAFLERIHDRALEERETADAPLARLLAKSLRPVSAPDGLGWPGERIEQRAGQVIGRSRRPRAVDELWERVRRDVREQVDMRRSVRRRLRFRVAVVAAAVLLGAWFATNWGTSRTSEIVFERLVETPAVSFPVAVLRHAHGE